MNKQASLSMWSLALAPLAILLAAVVDADDKPTKRPITLGIEIDRRRYDKDDTILVIATFEGEPRTKIQLSTVGGGSAYFYLILDAVSRKDEPVSRAIVSLQLKRNTEVARIGQESACWLQDVVPGGTSHQFCIHLPRLPKLAEGNYKMRIGYTRRHVEELAELVEQTLGRKVPLDGALTELVEDGWDGAVLSEPVTITIGPVQIAPSPRPVRP